MRNNTILKYQNVAGRRMRKSFEYLKNPLRDDLLLVMRGYRFITDSIKLIQSNSN